MAAKKVMYALFFPRTGLVTAIKLKNQCIVTANWYTTKYQRHLSQQYTYVYTYAVYT